MGVAHIDMAARFEHAGRIALQGLLITAAVLAYFGVRGLTDDDPDAAARNAGFVIRVERFLHINWERSIQSTIVGSDVATTLVNWIYIYGHWPVIGATLFWLAMTRPDVFRRARNALFLSGAIGLIVFVTVPVAPPRLADIGMADTITLHSNSYRVLQPATFTNQYAAMPSLHVGWNLIMGLAILTATRHVWLRALAVVMTAAMDWAVVLTANHYLLDVLAGAVLAAAVWRLMSSDVFTTGPVALRRRSSGLPASPASTTRWR